MKGEALHILTDSNQARAWKGREGLGLLVGWSEKDAIDPGWPCVRWEEYRNKELAFRETAREVVAMLERWANIRFPGGDVLKEQFFYEGHSLWDIVEPDLFWSFLYLLDDLRLVLHILSSVAPGEVFLYGNTHKIEKLFIAACKARNIPFKSSGVSLIASVDYELSSHLILRQVRIGNKVRHMRIPRHWLGLLHAFQVFSMALRHRRNPKPGAEVLYLCAGRDSGLEALLPETKKRGQNFAVMGMLGSAQAHRLSATEEPVDWLESYASARALWRAHKLRRRSARVFRALRADAVLQCEIAYAGVPLWDLAQPLLLDVLLWGMPSAVTYFEMMREVIRAYGIKVLVMPDKHVRQSRAVAFACRSGHVISVGLPNRCVDYMHGIPLGRPAQVEDWKLASGEKIKEWLIHLGSRAERIMVTGNPSWDSMIRDLSPHGECGKQVAAYAKTALIITSPATEMNRKEDKKCFLETVYGAIRRFPDVRFVVKLHPNETEDDERLLAKQMGLETLEIIKDVPLYPLLRSCDVLIFSNSTVGHEAVLMGKPIIQVNMSASEPDCIPCAEMGAAIGVYEKDEFAAVLRNVLSNQETLSALAIGRQRYIRTYMCADDGRAAERAARAIEIIRLKCSSVEPT